MSHILLIGVLFLNSAFGADLTAQKAFKTLQSLIGRWEAKTESGATIAVSYQLISGDSALVETFVGSSGKETLTIYHLDGETLVLTHYCAQQNQPRLLLTPESTKDNLIFSFKDITNLSDPENSHMRGLEVAFVDKDHFRQKSTYQMAGKDQADTLNFVRMP